MRMPDDLKNTITILEDEEMSRERAQQIIRERLASIPRSPRLTTQQVERLESYCLDLHKIIILARKTIRDHAPTPYNVMQ
jgi:hypothetical protein